MLFFQNHWINNFNILIIYTAAQIFNNKLYIETIGYIDNCCDEKRLCLYCPDPRVTL